MHERVLMNSNHPKGCLPIVYWNSKIDDISTVIMVNHHWRISIIL